MTAERWLILALAAGLLVTWGGVVALSNPGMLDAAALRVGLKTKAVPYG